MSNPFDFSLIEEALIQAKEKDTAYADAYQSYVIATNKTITVLIKLASTQDRNELALLSTHYRDSVTELLVQRKRIDDAQFERIDIQIMLVNIINLMRDEFLVVLKRHDRLLKEHEDQLNLIDIQNHQQEVGS